MRAEAGAAAAANRVKFGRTKAERLAEHAARAAAERVLDQSRREP